MNVRVSLCLLVVASLLTAGCSVSPSVRAHIATVNAENRRLEDRIYDLEYELQTACDKIDRLEGKPTDRGDGSNQNERSPAKKSPSSSGSTPGKSRLDLPDLPPPTIDSGSRGSAPAKRDSGIDLGEPQIDLGEPATKPKPLPPAPVPKPRLNSPQSSRFETPAFEPPRNASLPDPPPTSRNILDVPLPESSLGPTNPISTGGDDRITQLYLNPFLTASSDFDSKPGDDGLIVVLEPRNAAGEYVPLAGPISVVLLDSSKEGDAARVARWDFDTVDASRFLKKRGAGTGLHLQMTWPGSRPENSRLRLFVRYETPDHRFLQAEHEVFVTLPDQLSNRWTPRTRRGSAMASVPTTVASPNPTIDLSPPETAPSPLVVPEPPTAERPPSMFSPGEQTATQPRPTWKPQR